MERTVQAAWRNILKNIRRLYKMTQVLMPSPVRFGTQSPWFRKLKCRLERMDRRMALLRQKNESSPSKTSEISRSDVFAAASASAPQVGRTENQSRGGKRKHSLEPRNLNSKFNEVEDMKTTATCRAVSKMVNKSTCTDSTDAELTPTPTTPSKSKISRLSRSHKLKDSPSKQQLLLFSQQPPRKCRSQTPSKVKQEVQTENEDEKETEVTLKNNNKRSAPDDSDTDDEVQIMDHKSRKKNSAQSGSSPLPLYHDNNIMRTTNPYYVPVQIDLPTWDISPKKTKPDHVLVPTWKIKHVPTGYQLEGTENLTDEVYIKRHQKPEADEKRRKRWDAQMMREKKMVERLQQRGGNSTVTGSTPSKPANRKEPEEPELVSFFPNPDNAKYIEICDEVPVTAFGYPVPELVPTEFKLPWYDIDKHSKDEQHSRSARGRKKHS